MLIYIICKLYKDSQGILSIKELTVQKGILFIYSFLKLYWSRVDVQCCVNFRCIHSDSVIHAQVSDLFQILFPFRLLQNIKQSSLCYVVGSCSLFILYSTVCILIPNFYLIPPPYISTVVTIKFVFKICESVSVL